MLPLLTCAAESMFPSAAELGYQVVDRPAYSPAKLARFIWFNPTLSQREDDGHKKVLYYYPPSFSDFDMAQSVGLVQGIAGFTMQFCPDETCQALTTKKHKLSFFSPEPDFFLVIMAEVPKTLENGEKEVYLERELDPDMLKKAVRHAYDAFYLLHGRLADQMEARGPEGLKTLLKNFMTGYLPALDLSRADIFGVLDGVSFLPMERDAWLQAQCFVNEAEQLFPTIRGTAFFFKENLVCSTLDVAKLRPVCRYLFEFPPHRSQTRGDGSAQVGRPNWKVSFFLVLKSSPSPG